MFQWTWCVWGAWEWVPSEFKRWTGNPMSQMLNICLVDYWRLTSLMPPPCSLFNSHHTLLYHLPQDGLFSTITFDLATLSNTYIHSFPFIPQHTIKAMILKSTQSVKLDTQIHTDTRTVAGPEHMDACAWGISKQGLVKSLWAEMLVNGT